MARGKNRQGKVPVVVKGAEAETFGQVIDNVLATDSGKRLFIWLRGRLGFTKSSLSRKRDGSVDEVATDALEAQRLIYLELRNAASLELLHPVEEMADRQERAAMQKTLDGKSQEEVRK